MLKSFPSFASFPSLPDAPSQEAGDTSRGEEGGPALGATEGTSRYEEGGGGDEGDELDASELPAEFGIGAGGSGARPPSPAPNGKLAGFPAPPPFAGRGRTDDEACDEGDDLSEMPVEFFSSSAAPPTPPMEMPMEFFACAAAAGAGAGRLGASSSAAPRTSRAARALQALPMNQVKSEAPTKGNLSEPLSTPFQDAFQELSDAFHRALDSDSDSARPAKLAEKPNTAGGVFTTPGAFPQSVCGIIDL